MLVLRMTNEREMSVENEGEMAGHCETLEERQTRGQGGQFWRRRRSYFGNALKATRST